VSFDLRALRLPPGEQRRIPIIVALEAFTIGGEVYAAEPGNAPAELAVTRLRNGWVFEERFRTDVRGTCHRCLGPAVVPLEVEVHELHAPGVDPADPEETTCEYLDDLVLDTDRMASDAVVLEMPLVVLCRPDCAGLCARCGADLNLGACGCG
jgi:uncharacterized protein